MYVCMCVCVCIELYYVYFQANTLGKGMNTLIMPAIGYLVPLFFYENGFGIK